MAGDVEQIAVPGGRHIGRHGFWVGGELQFQSAAGISLPFRSSYEVAAGQFVRFRGNGPN